MSLTLDRHVVVGALAASAPLGYYAPDRWAARGVTLALALTLALTLALA